MNRTIRIGTRESQLALWQANEVKRLLEDQRHNCELVYIKSEGDIDLVTPLYELGVQGVFTKSLDAALLNDRIDIAVHSMKDVPIMLAKGIQQAAVLPRASHKDIFVFNGEANYIANELNCEIDAAVGTKWNEPTGARSISDNFIIGTSSIRRRAQWLYRYPAHKIENLRGNVNTRLQKMAASNWNGAIFAAAGLERIDVRPDNSIDLDWMLPAPAQGAIMIVARENDEYCLNACAAFNDADTELCTKIERDFLKTLLGGCSTPISALAEIMEDRVLFRGNIALPDGSAMMNVERQAEMEDSSNLGVLAAQYILENGGRDIVEQVRNVQ
jgi:hydroxymethylbilane synthase